MSQTKLKFNSSTDLCSIDKADVATISLHSRLSPTSSKKSNNLQHVTESVKFLRKVKSLPAISYPLNEEVFRSRSKTLNTKIRPPPKPNLQISCELNELKKSKWINDNSKAQASISAQSENSQRRIKLINCDNIKVWTDQSESSSSKLASESENVHPSVAAIKKTKSSISKNSIFTTLFGTTPTYSSWMQLEQALPALNTGSSTYNGGSVFDAFMPIYGQKMQVNVKDNLFEEGVSTLDSKEHHFQAKPMAELPSSSLRRTEPRNQSLTAFLQSAHLSRNNTDLEKENAHFRISEAVISAIEHIKWAKSEPKKSDEANATDCLKGKRSLLASNLKSSDKEKIAKVDSNDCISEGEHSMHRFETMSAEVVGLSLISKFSDQQLPKVSELKWLVSDEDTPQQLLPMPDQASTNISDDFPPMTRGTRYWAPPRPQIIFTEHPIPNRIELIRRQNNRCAGCGMRVSQQHLNSFRYCTYFGKYHCTGCHRNQMSVTPAKILKSWDFKCYPVSVFAYRLLDQIYTIPLFHVPDLNPALYSKIKNLFYARNKRIQLKFVKDFIKACRFASSERSYFDTIPDYIYQDADTWSISDFFDVRNGSMQRSINDLIEKCENHILHCVLCTGRGFCCEYCLVHRVIYPWSDNCYQCDRCGSCFHSNCWKAMEVCCRCQRIQNRQNEIAEATCDEQ